MSKTNDILEKQNRPEFIRMIKAQRVAYSYAKKYQMGYEAAAVLVAILLPVVYIFFPEYKTGAGWIGAVFSIAAIIIDRVQKHITKDAASIQEQFDRELFGLDWDNYSGAKKVDLNKIISYSEKYKKKDVQNWYSENITSDIPHNIAVLLCQRANLHWDKTLRKKYRLLIGLLALIFIALMVTAIGIHFSRTRDFCFNIFLLLVGSAAFIKYCYTVIIDKTDIIKEKEDLAAKIDALIEEYRKSNRVPAKEDLSRIQTAIFISRKKSVKIPDWFYYRFRDKQEKEMNQTTKIVKDEFLKSK